MIYVGIDPSLTNTGVAILNSEGEILRVHNVKDSVKREKTASWEYERLGRIRDNILETIFYYTDEFVVAYEGYSFNSTNKAFTTGELGGVLKLAFVELKKRLIVVEPTVLKKFSTGNGQAAKDKMVNQALKESDSLKCLGGTDLTDDICDAFFLAKFAWYVDSPETAVEHETATTKKRQRLEISKPYRSV